MATVNKDFKIKQGLIVEGTTATVNGYDLLKKSAADDEYIIGLIGGTATSANTPNTVVKRDGDGKFSATEITADLIGYVTGQVSNISNHSTSNLTEGSRLYFTDQRALDATASAYDASGAAATAYTDATTFATSADTALYGTVTTDLNTHAEASSGVHGVNGNVVGTTDAQNISNKRIMDTLYFTDNGTSNMAEVRAMPVTHDFEIKANSGNLNLKSVAENVNISASNADIVLDANGDVYLGYAYPGNQVASQSYVDNSISTAATDATTKANAAETAAKAYTDSEVAALVDSAPALLDTLNELAAAIADNPNYASDVANLVATKADTSYVNSEISNLNGAAQGYASAAQAAAAADATTKANAAQSAAAADATTKANAAQSAAATDATTKANAAQAAAVATASLDARARVNASESSLSTFIFETINALDTDDIEEGLTNQYFLDSRAKTSAADLLIGATKTNITITGSGSGLTITAENGVADSNTDDLTEGSTNLYFTDARAVSALEAVVPNFTAVELNSVAKQVAATLEAATAGVQTAYAFAKSEYRSAEFLVKVAYGTHTEISKVLLTLDTSDNIALTEYGIVGTNGSASTVSAGISGTNVTLLVTTNNNNSTVTVMGTLLV